MAALPLIGAPAVDPQYQPSVRLATDLGMLDNLGGNAVELLTDYKGTIDRIAADIDAARHHVHLCFYIFGDDARSAPLDRWCRFRGLPNLYVVDASVMPTSGTVNPSLTIATNALRVGTRLAEGTAAEEKAA